MNSDFGAAFSIGGAIIYYILATYIATRKNKNVSHFLFIGALVSLGFSETMAFFEFTGSAYRAYHLLKYDLSSLAIGAYFLLIFADYFREGFNKRFIILSFIPVIFIIYIVFTVMIIDVSMGPYGWTGVYHETYHLIYSIYALSYVTAALGIFIYIYRKLNSGTTRAKIAIFIIALSIVVIGGFINAVTIIFIGRIFPIVETSLMIFGIVSTFALANK